MVADNDSMYNTPPTYAIYIAGLVFKWLKRQGGLARMGETNKAKAANLYRAIDESDFYRNPVAPTCRSLPCFRARPPTPKSGMTPTALCLRPCAECW